MSAAMLAPWVTWFAEVSPLPTTRGAFESAGGEMYSPQSLPDDPVGVFTLTLTNVVAGSSIFISDQAGTTTLHSSTASSDTVVIPLQAYAGGSPLNNLRIKVRKGSAAPKYLPFTTLATAFVGTASVFVAQVPDLIA